MCWSKMLTKQLFGSESSFLLEQFTTLLCGAAVCAAALQEQKNTEKRETAWIKEFSHALPDWVTQNIKKIAH